MPGFWADRISLAVIYAIIGLYHHRTGNDDEARRICRMLRDVAPDEGATKMLDRELHAEALRVLIDALDPVKISRLLNSWRDTTQERPENTPSTSSTRT